MNNPTIVQAMPVHITSSNYSVKRNRPVKPARAQEESKEANSEEAIEFLNAVMSDMRKEIRSRKTLTVKGKVSKINCDMVTFLSDTFSITIDFKGGIAV